jgi:PEP-CTERM motif
MHYLRFGCAVVLGAVLLFVQAAPASATSISLGSIQDASIADTVSSNQGSNAEFLVNWAGAGSSLGLIQFDLSGIPLGSTILGATLTLYHEFNSGNGRTYDFFQNTSAWSESTVIYASRPTFAAAPVSSLTIADTNFGVFRSFNFTAVTQSWVNGAPNFGLTLVQNLDDPNWIYFASRDFNNPGFRPRLDIEFTAADSAAVPEPASMMLLGTGLAAFAALRRRRKNQ